MAETLAILSNPLMKDFLLPFLLVFALAFAVLEKSEILGKGKRQINAIVSLVLALIVVSFGYATNIINSIIPVFAIALVLLLLFMLVWGMAYKEAFDMPHQMKIVVGVVAGILAISAIVYFTGVWDRILGLFKGTDSSGIVSSVIIIVVLAAAVVVVVWPSGKGAEKEKKD